MSRAAPSGPNSPSTSLDWSKMKLFTWSVVRSIVGLVQTDNERSGLVVRLYGPDYWAPWDAESVNSLEAARRQCVEVHERGWGGAGEMRY